jgi:hypothetical protein
MMNGVLYFFYQFAFKKEADQVRIQTSCGTGAKICKLHKVAALRYPHWFFISCGNIALRIIYDQRAKFVSIIFEPFQNPACILNLPLNEPVAMIV